MYIYLLHDYYMMFSVLGNPSKMLIMVLKKYFLLFSQLNMVVLINICMKTVIFLSGFFDE